MSPAKEYPTDKIRNVVVVGHGGSGKTNLVDSLCFVAGSSPRKGNIVEGLALTMYTPEEIDHGMSLQATPAFCEHGGVKINLLDTPGFIDFTGETLSAMRVADCAVVVVSAISGVEVGTDTVWEYARERGVSRFVFISMMDKENASFQSTFEGIQKHLSDKAIPVTMPIGEGPEFRGVVDLFTEKAHIFKSKDGKGRYTEDDVPQEMKAEVERRSKHLQEALAMTHEDLMDVYFEQGRIPTEDALVAMEKAVLKGNLIPIFCGSSLESYGMREMLDGLVSMSPSPADVGPQILGTEESEDMEELPADDNRFSALIYKTSSEPHIGELSFFRVFSGSVRNGETVRNTERGAAEKLSHLSVSIGKERLEVGKLNSGDLGVVAKLKDSHTNDTLCGASSDIVLPKIKFPEPEISVAIQGETRADDDKLGEVLAKLQEEDPTFVSEFNAELHQTIARGLGEMHLEIQMERMKRKYGVGVTTHRRKIAYRETLTKLGEGQGRHKKQSGGRGQFGDCWVRLRPLPPGSGYQFKSSIKGGVIPSKYIPAVDRGIQEAAQGGVLSGFPLVDFEAECYDGSYHSVDSSELAFKLAGSQAFRSVAHKCRPVLLEPIIEVSVTTPDEYVGDIMSDINGRRGKVLGMEPKEGRTTVKALIPESELYRYATSLRAITQGRAHHSRKDVGFDAVPEKEIPRLIANNNENSSQV